MPENVNKSNASGRRAAQRRDSGTQDELLRELQEKNAILGAAERLAKVRGWSYDLASHRLQWSCVGNSILSSPQELQDFSLFHCFRRIYPLDRPALARLIRDVSRGERQTFTFKYRLLPTGGEQRSVAGAGEVLFGPDRMPRRVAGSIMETRDERAPGRTDLDYTISALEESSSVWLWEQDQEFRFTSLTRTRDTTLNEQHGSVIGKCRWEAPDCVPCSGTWEDHQKVLEQRLSFHEFEYRARLPAGQERVFSTTGVPAYASDGRFIGYRGTASDITALKRAEEDASQSQALLRLASRLGRVGAWALDLESMAGSWSRELFSLYELDPRQPLTVDVLMSFAAADRRDVIHAAMRACHMHGTPVDIEFPSLTAKGNQVWLHLMAEAVRDSSGAIVRMQGAVQDVAERKRDAERLRALNRQLTTTFESITDAFVTVDRQLRFTYVNAEAERRSGLSRSDLLGKRVDERFPLFAKSDFRREFERALMEGTAGTAEAYSSTFGLWLKVHVFPSEQGLALYFHDVTESKSAQQQLALSEERYRLLFETGADGILKVLPDGRIWRANRAACEMFGMTEAEMAKMTSKQLVSSADKRLGSMLRARLQRGSARGELTMVRADASTFEAEVNASTFENSQGETFVNIVVRDATERIQLRQKLTTLNEELAERVRQRTRELERANSELREFARSLAHDLRQPIAAAKSFGFALENALSKSDAQAARQFAGQMNGTTDWLGRYVDALLSLTRISQTALKLEDVDLSALALSLMDELQDQQPDRQALVEVQPGVRAKGDRTLLRVLLQNLLGNAWKFTGRKELARITFAASSSSEGEMVYSVEDNGAGFDMSRAERLFQTFQRFHRESEFSGTGIGLANAHRIVLRHRGRMWAESQPNCGAAFFFTLGTPDQDCGRQDA